VARAAADRSASVLRFMFRFLQDIVGAKAQRVPEQPGDPAAVAGRGAMAKAACGGATAPAATLAR
jgi:hypothetical protein